MYIDSDEELDRYLREYDKRVSDKYGDVFTKTVMAYFEITGNKSMPGSDPGYTGIYDPFQGYELAQKINAWYKVKYGVLGNIGLMFGTRKIIIRGQLLLVDVPTIINGKAEDMDPFKYIRNLPESLKAMLDAKEIASIRAKFNAFYIIGSRLALCSVVVRNKTTTNEVVDFITRGRSDLIASIDSFVVQDPNPALWSASQAVEKYLKAFIMDSDRQITAKHVKDLYSHNLERLAKKSSEIDAFLKCILPFCSEFKFTADDRYKPPKYNLVQSLDFVDGAFAVCDAVGQVILSRHNAPNKSAQLTP